MSLLWPLLYYEGWRLASLKLSVMVICERPAHSGYEGQEPKDRHDADASPDAVHSSGINPLGDKNDQRNHGCNPRHSADHEAQKCKDASVHQPRRIIEIRDVEN